MGTTDSDFAEAKFIDVYNGDLANGIGNCFNRIANMTNKYFDGYLPEPHQHDQAPEAVHGPASELFGDLMENQHFAENYVELMGRCDLESSVNLAGSLIGDVDRFIERTQPFKLAKDPDRLPEVGTILYNCAEAMRIASLLLWPVIPDKVEELWRRMQLNYGQQLADRGRGALNDWLRWGQLEPGTLIEKGAPLFPRQEVAKS
jgi:methionyl-tRNA synthetase